MNLIASNVNVRKSQTSVHTPDARRALYMPRSAELDVFPCINLISTFHKQHRTLIHNPPNHLGDGVSISE